MCPLIQVNEAIHQKALVYFLKGIAIKYLTMLLLKIWLKMKWFLQNALKYHITSKVMLEETHVTNQLLDCVKTMLEANEK